MAEVCDRIFEQTAHLHGLTRTVRPLLGLAAVLYDSYGPRGDERGPEDLTQALKVSVPDLSPAQRRIVLGSLCPNGPQEEAVGAREAVAREVARRMAAILQIADGLDDARTCDATIAAALDDGQALELLVSGGQAVRDNVAAAAERLALWNSLMPRPIRTVVVYEGKTPPSPLLPENPTFADVARRVFQTQWEQFTSRAYGLRCGEDIEYVHEMRVALRRVRAALKVFRRAVNGALPAFRDEVRQLADALGAVRDADVFLVFLRRYAAGAPAEHLPYLRRFIRSEQRKRRRHYRALLDLFESERFADLRRRYDPILNGGLQSLAGEADEPLALHAPRILKQRLKQVARYRRRLDQFSPEEQHALRIQCKKLRYTAEFFSDVYAAGLKALIAPMTEMQDALGDVHDADVYRERVLRHHRRRRTGQGDAAEDAASAALLAHLQSWREESLSRAASTWRAFSKSKAPRKAVKAIPVPSA